MEHPRLMRKLLPRALTTCSLILVLLAAGCATVDAPPLPPADTAAPSPEPASAEVPPAAIPADSRVAAAQEPAAATAVPEEAQGVPAPAPPRGRLDPEQDAQRNSLWDRIRSQWGMPDLEGARVGKWEQYYAGQPDYVQRMFERGARYLFHIVEEVERRELPAELALLPFIESAFNPQAQSRARASGMWQFMPATGKDFELRQNIFRDDRRDVLASTRAALQVVQRLHRLFGDWQLALAAYNWGQGSVMRAISRNRRA
jgi:membrane-bound lytic murein transglycosylase D